MAYRMGLLGKKVGMTQKFTDKGVWQSLCVLEVGPCVVTGVMTPDRNGYSAVQFGFGAKNERSTAKPQLVQFARAKTSPKQYVREIRLSADEAAKFTVGQTVSVAEVFRPGDMVDVTGVSKGKGFQGVMKRHHFGGFKATHGTHEYFRHGGSIGCRLTPGRVYKGKAMAGQMGNRIATVQNIRVAEVLEDKNLLLLAGAVPGATDSFLTVRQAAKHPARKFVARAPEPPPPPAEPEVEAAQ